MAKDIANAPAPPTQRRTRLHAAPEGPDKYSDQESRLPGGGSATQPSPRRRAGSSASPACRARATAISSRGRRRRFSQRRRDCSRAEPLPLGSVRAVERGILLVPADRRGAAIVPALSVRANLCLGAAFAARRVAGACAGRARNADGAGLSAGSASGRPRPRRGSARSAAATSRRSRSRARSRATRARCSSKSRPRASTSTPRPKSMRCCAGWRARPDCPDHRGDLRIRGTHRPRRRDPCHARGPYRHQLSRRRGDLPPHSGERLVLRRAAPPE